MVGKVVIKKPKITDAVEIQNLLYFTWIDTYVDKKSNIDLQDIASIDFLAPKNVSRRKMKIREMNRNSGIFVAVYKNKIIGECSFEKKEDCGIIKSIYVLPNYQNKGVGYTLYQSALNRILPVKKIIVELAENNEKAFNFYGKLGFKKNNTTGSYVFPNGKSLPIFGMEIDLNI